MPCKSRKKSVHRRAPKKPDKKVYGYKKPKKVKKK